MRICLVKHLSLRPRNYRNAAKELYGSEYSTFGSSPCFTCHWHLHSISEADNYIQFIFQWLVNHRPESSVEFLFPYKLLARICHNIGVLKMRIRIRVRV